MTRDKMASQHTAHNSGPDSLQERRKSRAKSTQIGLTDAEISTKTNPDARRKKTRQDTAKCSVPRSKEKAVMKSARVTNCKEETSSCNTSNTVTDMSESVLKSMSSLRIGGETPKNVKVTEMGEKDSRLEAAMDRLSLEGEPLIERGPDRRRESRKASHQEKPYSLTTNTKDDEDEFLKSVLYDKEVIGATTTQPVGVVNQTVPSQNLNTFPHDSSGSTVQLNLPLNVPVQPSAPSLANTPVAPVQPLPPQSVSVYSSSDPFYLRQHGQQTHPTGPNPSYILVPVNVNWNQLSSNPGAGTIDSTICAPGPVNSSIQRDPAIPDTEIVPETFIPDPPKVKNCRKKKPKGEVKKKKKVRGTSSDSQTSSVSSPSKDTSQQTPVASPAFQDVSSSATAPAHNNDETFQDAMGFISDELSLENKTCLKDIQPTLYQVNNNTDVLLEDIYEYSPGASPCATDPGIPSSSQTSQSVSPAGPASSLSQGSQSTSAESPQQYAHFPDIGDANSSQDILMTLLSILPSAEGMTWNNAGEVTQHINNLQGLSGNLGSSQTFVQNNYGTDTQVTLWSPPASSTLYNSISPSVSLSNLEQGWAPPLCPTTVTCSVTNQTCFPAGSIQNPATPTNSGATQWQVQGQGGAINQTANAMTSQAPCDPLHQSQVHQNQPNGSSYHDPHQSVIQDQTDQAMVLNPFPTPPPPTLPNPVLDLPDPSPAIAASSALAPSGTTPPQIPEQFVNHPTFTNLLQIPSQATTEASTPAQATIAPRIPMTAGMISGGLSGSNSFQRILETYIPILPKRN